MLFDRRRRGLALQRFDVGGDRDRLNVFEVLIPRALDPGQELLDCPVIGSSRVSVPDRDCKELEELFPDTLRFEVLRCQNPSAAS